MELAKAHLMATNLMAKHGLIARGWRFDFDNAPKRLGVCKHRLRLISLSRHFVGAADAEQVEQTILHEIAHALLPHSAQAHGAEWKAKAASIGYKGKRTARNPYAEAQRRTAGVLPMEPVAFGSALPEVKKGDKVLANGIEWTIVSKGTKRWHATSPQAPFKKLTIPFEVAHNYLVK